jgi:hypothetical protein
MKQSQKSGRTTNVTSTSSRLIAAGFSLIAFLLAAAPAAAQQTDKYPS